MLLAGCAGDTLSATNVRAASAQLNAHGHTNNGPASWWWEYGLSRSAVAGGTGTKTPKAGPASSATDVDLNRTVSGFAPGQQYYFRACGQDQAAGSSATCGRVLSFRTALGDSTVAHTSTTVDGTSVGHITYTAAPGVPHVLDITQDDSNGGDIIRFDELSVGDATPSDTSDLVSSTPECTLARGSLAVFNVANCDPSKSNDFYQLIEITGSNQDDSVLEQDVLNTDTVSLGDGNDTFSATGNGSTVDGGNGNDVIAPGAYSPSTVHGGPGNDQIYANDGLTNDVLDGGPGNDTIDGGAGDDTITGGDGDDTIDPGTYSSNGDTIDCGPGHDTVIGPVPAADKLTGCEVITSGPSATRKAR